jgi:MFS family permease
MAAVEQTEGRPAERTLFGHPVGLANLFGVELWERFSFYGMLTILGYYLYYSVTEGGLELPKTTATGIVGAYGGLVYLSTVLGGWIADRLLGMERTVFYGGVVVMCGHIALAILPGLAGVAVGLVLVALGSGALKANASSLLGTLYEKGDARCDGGFTLFYLGINLGAFIGPLITGLLQTRAGFHYGFGAAAVGMALGLAQYVAFRRNLGTHGRNVPNPLPRSATGWVIGIGAAIVVIIAVAFVTGLVKLSNLSQVTTGVIVAASVAYFVVMLTSSKVAAIERTRVRAFIPLFIANAVFWSLFQQIFTVLAVLGRADELVDLRLDGAVELDRLDRTRLDHRALTAFRDHVDAAGQSRADHTAQVRIRRDRDGPGLFAVSADVWHDGQGCACAARGRHHGSIRGLRVAAVADRAVGHHKACARGVSGSDDGAVLLLGGAWHVDVGRAGALLRSGTRIRVLRDHRSRCGFRRHHRIRDRAVDQPVDGGRALGRCACRRGQVVTCPKPNSRTTQVSMGTGSHARASDRTTRFGST